MLKLIQRKFLNTYILTGAAADPPAGSFLLFCKSQEKIKNKNKSCFYSQSKFPKTPNLLNPKRVSAEAQQVSKVRGERAGRGGGGGWCVFLSVFVRFFDPDSAARAGSYITFSFFSKIKVLGDEIRTRNGIKSLNIHPERKEAPAFNINITALCLPIKQLIWVFFYFLLSQISWYLNIISDTLIPISVPDRAPIQH